MILEMSDEESRDCKEINSQHSCELVAKHERESHKRSSSVWSSLENIKGAGICANLAIKLKLLLHLVKLFRSSSLVGISGIVMQFSNHIVGLVGAVLLKEPARGEREPW